MNDVCTVNLMENKYCLLSIVYCHLSLPSQSMPTNDMSRQNITAQNSSGTLFPYSAARTDKQSKKSATGLRTDFRKYILLESILGTFQVERRRRFSLILDSTVFGCSALD